MTHEILGLPPSLVQRRDHGVERIPAGALVLLQRAGLPFAVRRRILDVLEAASSARDPLGGARLLRDAAMATVPAPPEPAEIVLLHRLATEFVRPARR